MLAQIQGLFDGGELDTPGADNAARKHYIQANNLHRLFLAAVDAAMQQNAQSPAKFVGGEFLAARQQQAAPRDPAAAVPDLRYSPHSY